MAKSKKMTPADLALLILAATESRPTVTQKKMFGCPVFFAKDKIFALIWQDSRIGLKLPDETSREALMSMPGSEPWIMARRKIARWVLVPVAFHKKPTELEKWACLAYDQCVDQKEKASSKIKGKAAKRSRKAN